MDTSLAAAYAAAGPGLDPGWLDAMIDPLETRTWISMGIEAASQSRDFGTATWEFNMGVLQT